MNKINKIALFGLGSINWIGGVQYITNIIFALDSIHDEHPLEIHLIKTERQKFTELAKIKNTKIIVHEYEDFFPPWTLFNRGVWFLQRKLMKRVSPRVENTFINQNFDFVFPQPLSDCNGQCNSAAWIADFQYHFYPDWASADFTNAAYHEVSFIANHAHKVVLSSRAIEKDCHDIFPVTKDRSFAVPFAVHIDADELKFADFGEIIDKYKIPREFMMVSNSFCPTKNHKTIFQAMQLLNKQGIKVNLVCTGNIVDQRNLHFANEILQMLTEYQVRDQVYLVGIIPRSDQISMYRMAKAVIQPSLNEGWSTSVEEAKCLGKELIASAIPVHQEQCSNSENLFRPLDARDLADKMGAIWKKTSGKTFPDIQEEKSAFDQYQQLVREFGRQFLKMAES